MESTTTSRPRTRPTRHVQRPYFLRRSGGWGTASQTLTGRGEQILQIRCTYYGSTLNTRVVALVRNWSKGDSKWAAYWRNNRMASTSIFLRSSYVLTNRKVEISCLQQRVSLLQTFWAFINLIGCFVFLYKSGCLERCLGGLGHHDEADRAFEWNCRTLGVSDQ